MRAVFLENNLNQGLMSKCNKGAENIFVD